MKTNQLVLVLAVAAAGYFFYESRFKEEAPTTVPTQEEAAQASEATKPAPDTGTRPTTEPAGQPPASRPGPTAPSPRFEVAAGGSGNRYRYFGEAGQLRQEAEQALQRGRPAWGAFLLRAFLRYEPESGEAASVRDQLTALFQQYHAAGQDQIQSGHYDEARRSLTVAYFACWKSHDERAGIQGQLDGLSEALLFAPQHSQCAPYIEVQSGDYLQKIARKAGVPVDWVQRINRLQGSMIRVGQRLKVPQGPVEVWVSKRDFRVYVLLGDAWVRSYQVGTGRNDCTPEATFAIGTKQVEPTWYQTQPDGRVLAFPFGDPRNILGTRWLGFQHDGQRTSFGIHGTAMPETVGTESSDGCLRMRNAEVEDLYGMVPRGARVVILR